MNRETQVLTTTDELATECQELLAEAESLVIDLKGTVYRMPGPGPIGGVGAQVRHLTDFFGAFLDGLAAGRVDYDRRPRDPRIESDPARAGEALAEIQSRIETQDWPAGPLQVCMDDERARWTTSSVERELRFLHTHTIHHFAIIRLLLETSGYRVAPGFGLAPSTMLHRSRLAERAERE